MSLSHLRNEFYTGRLAKAEFIAAMHTQHTALFDYAMLLPQTDISAIEITDNSVMLTARLSGVKFLCDRNDYRIAPIEILNFGAYESTELDMVRRLIKPGYTVLDIGANIGWYALTIARLLPDVEVHAFEPIPKTFAYLLANAELNQLPNIHLYDFGFSNAEGELTFYYYPEGSVNACLLYTSPSPRDLSTSRMPSSA